MNAQDYINNELELLKKPLGLAIPSSGQLENEIVRLVLSKKFRKYSASEDTIAHIKNAVHLAVSQNQPIKFVFPHGAYKLWRLDETPQADFAELFAFMYYSHWLKPISEIYEPGVWFDLFIDDLILLKLNNLRRDEIEEYLKSEQQILDFLKQYQPSNMKMTMTPNSSLFATEDDFWTALDNALQKTPLPVLNDQQKIMVELNVRPIENMPADWREKTLQLHTAYSVPKGELSYHKNNPEKIGVFTTPLPIPGYVAVGSTKSSIMKFWIGVGALRPKYDSFEMVILSGNQLEKTKFGFEPISLNGLTGKNFFKIRVIKA
jgi:hypothetical protein